jgi:hypothetical protein
MPDGGLDLDAGDAGDGSIGSNSDACRQVCNAGAPAGANQQQFGVCYVQPLDGGGGLLLSCGGCGI